jgi:hypothetical protein
MTVKDIILAYFQRAKPEITANELTRVLSLNKNTVRKELGAYTRKDVLRKKRKGLLRRSYYYLNEEQEDYVIKYLSSVLYCGSIGSNHHGTKKTAYAYTFEPTDLKDNNRADDLYEAIRAKPEAKYCHEIDIVELDQFGKNYGYGVEPRKRIEEQFIYPNIAVKIDGRLV